MPDKNEKEMDTMKKSYEKSTGMKVIQHPNPPAGTIEFAKDKKQPKGQ